MRLFFGGSPLASYWSQFAVDGRTGFNSQFFIGDGTSDRTSAANSQTTVDSDFAFEFTSDGRFVDFYGAVEHPFFSNLENVGTLQSSLNSPFDNQMVTRFDFARQGDAFTDEEAALGISTGSRHG